jgi:hypothetical protein
MLQPLNQTGRDLLLAARIVEERGLHKGSFHGTDGVCVGYAVILAAVDGVEENTIYEWLLQFPNAQGRAHDALALVKKHPKVNNEYVAMWNDNPKTTKEDVVQVLRECAWQCTELV